MDTNQLPNCSVVLDASRALIFRTPTSRCAYLGLVMVHLCLIVTPSIIITVIAVAFISRLPKHPSKIVYYWICALCLVGPLTYALVMDASLAFDSPIFGSCKKKWNGIGYWWTHSTLETSLLWIFALNAVLSYLSIRSTNRRFRTKTLNGVMVAIIVLAAVESCLFVVLTENYSAKRCIVQGSFCVTVFESPRGAVMTLEYLRIFIGALPVLITVPIIVVLYWYKVKTSVVHFDRALSRCLINVSASLLVGTFLWTLPTMILHLSTYRGRERTFVSLLTTYILQLNYVLYPFLILTLHKDLREGIIKSFMHIRNWLGIRSNVPAQEYVLSEMPHPPRRVLQEPQSVEYGVILSPPSMPQDDPLPKVPSSAIVTRRKGKGMPLQKLSLIPEDVEFQEMPYPESLTSPQPKTQEVPLPASPEPQQQEVPRPESLEHQAIEIQRVPKQSPSEPLDVIQEPKPQDTEIKKVLSSASLSPPEPQDTEIKKVLTSASLSPQDVKIQEVPISQDTEIKKVLSSAILTRPDTKIQKMLTSASLTPFETQEGELPSLLCRRSTIPQMPPSDEPEASYWQNRRASAPGTAKSKATSGY